MPFRITCVLATALCIICIGAEGIAAPSTTSSSAGPKSLDLSGAENTWFYGYYGQIGQRGFFGDYNVDASSTPGRFASLNGWIGNPPPTGDIANALVSGTNAAISTVDLNTTPQYGTDLVNLKARYTINTYVTSSAPGAVTPISVGQLTLWSVKVRTPLADIRIGKQVFRKGCSLQFSDNRTNEYLMLERTYVVPDLLGSLVARGVLPKGAMSWFKPHTWLRYKKVAGQPEPDDVVFCGGESEICASDSNSKGGDEKTDAGSTDTEDSPEATTGAKDPSTDDAPYAWAYAGPGALRIGIGCFFWQTPSPFPGSSPQFPPGFRTLSPFIDPITGLPVPFNVKLLNQNDLGLNALNNLIGAITYTSSDLEVGIGCLRSTYHQGPESLVPLQASSTVAFPSPPIVLVRASSPTFESYVTEGWSYLKYNNGDFFINTELDWFNRVFRFQRSLDGTFFGYPDTTDGSGSLFAPRYWESWRYMAEVGAVFGPLAVRFFYSFMPGPDRRHGVLIDRQPFVQENPQQALGLFDPYSSLLSYRFGAGVNAPGHISDASVYAVKLDYLLAANLLIEGSFMKAIRNSHGYAVGYIRPTASLSSFGGVTYREPSGSTFTEPAPSIPEKDLGWEAMAAITWKLMEEWVLVTRVSYWQPGRWFNYACIDKSVPNWDIPSQSNNWGIRPDRAIDAILGFELTLGASY